MISSFELIELFLKDYFRSSNKKVTLINYHEDNNYILIQYNYVYIDIDNEVIHGSEFEITYLELLTFIYNESIKTP